MNFEKLACTRENLTACTKEETVAMLEIEILNFVRFIFLDVRPVLAVIGLIMGSIMILLQLNIKRLLKEHERNGGFLKDNEPLRKQIKLLYRSLQIIWLPLVAVYAFSSIFPMLIIPGTPMAAISTGVFLPLSIILGLALAMSWKSTNSVASLMSKPYTGATLQVDGFTCQIKTINKFREGWTTLQNTMGDVRHVRNSELLKSGVIVQTEEPTDLEKKKFGLFSRKRKSN